MLQACPRKGVGHLLTLKHALFTQIQHQLATTEASPLAQKPVTSAEIAE